MFTLDDLAGMREVQASALPDTAVITRPTRTSDSAGGYTTVLATVATVNCRIAKNRPREILAGNRELTYADWTVTLPYGTAVLAGDTITVSGQSYQVVSVLVGSWNTAVRAYCVGAG